MKVNVTVHIEDAPEGVVDTLMGALDPHMQGNSVTTSTSTTATAAASTKPTASKSANKPAAVKTDSKPAETADAEVVEDTDEVQPNWDLTDEDIEDAVVTSEQLTDQPEAEAPDAGSEADAADSDVIRDRFAALADSNFDAAAGLLEKLGVARFGELDAEGLVNIAKLMDELN